MSATFEIKVTSIRTGTVGTMTDVVKVVDFTVKGTEDGEVFELPQTVTLSDPQSETFKPLAQLTETDVVAWIEAQFENLPAVKSHIQYVLDKQLEKGRLTSTPLPWAPAPTEPTPPAP